MAKIKTIIGESHIVPFLLLLVSIYLHVERVAPWFTGRKTIASNISFGLGYAVGSIGSILALAAVVGGLLYFFFGKERQPRITFLELFSVVFFILTIATRYSF